MVFSCFDSPLRAISTALMLVVLTLAAYDVKAQDVPWTIEHYQHTSWTSREGAPVGITSLTQTRDGYLWIGGERGLVRFDGVQFESFVPLKGEALFSKVVHSLCADSKGGLWIDYEAAGISYLKDAHLTHYGSRSGLPSHHLHLVCNYHGDAWIVQDSGIWRFTAGRWRAARSNYGLPEKPLVGFVDSQQTLWVTTKGGLYSLRQGEQRFQYAGVAITKLILSISEAPDGSLLLMPEGGPVLRYFRQNGMLVEDKHPIPVYTAAIAADRRGGLWFAGLGDGVYRLADEEHAFNTSPLPFAQKAQHFMRKDGLSGDYAWPVIMDRDGSIWVGTSRGLDRFRESNFVAAPLPESAHDFALAPGSNGSVWIGSSDFPVMHLSDEGLKITNAPLDMMAAWENPKTGEVLTAGLPNVWRMEPGPPEHLVTLPGDLALGSELGLARDSKGRLWIDVRGHGLAMLDPSSNVWRLIPFNEFALAFHIDSADTVWVGFNNSRLVSFNDGHEHDYGANDGLSVGTVKALTDHAGLLWVGGNEGVGYGRDGVFHAVKLVGALPLHDVTGLVFANDGSMWIHTTVGIVRIPKEDVDAVERGVDRPLNYRLFNEADGIPGPASQLIPLPSAIQTSDGRLWFATELGVVWIDPTNLIPPYRATSVNIESLTANDTTWRDFPLPELPPGTRSLTIAFSAPSLAVPERVRFRYRLEGVDHGWQDAPPQREVHYTNLGPGHYQFAVEVGTNDDVWDEQEATVEFTILPRLFETWWFHAICIAVASILLGLLILWRMKSASAKLRLKLETKYQERDRIARDLHDTVLQGMAGLIIHVESISASLPENDKNREILYRLSINARNAMVDGRQRILALRSDSGSQLELSVAIERLGADLATLHPAAFRCKLDGMPYPLDSSVKDELLDISREAMLNAFTHAQATLIEAKITYAKDELVIVILDDGCGIDETMLVKGRRPNHWGLLIMKARAKSIGAALNVSRSERGGTIVRLAIAARRVCLK